MRTETAQPIRLSDYRAPDWKIETVDLDVNLDPTKTRVRAKLSIKPLSQGAPAPLVLDGDELTLVSLAINGKALSPEAFAATPDQLTIPQPPNQPFVLEIETLLDPSSNTKLMGLYRSSGTYCTQCEAEGFRRITYFLDRPDVMSVYTTRIEAERKEAPHLLANGNLTSSGDIPGTTRHFAVWHDPFPKPSYLFAMVGGDLGCVDDTFVTQSGRKVALKIFVEHGKESRAAYAMDALKRSMRWDEGAFGREYDLDIFMIVAVSDFNMGAMENKGLNVFNDKYVLASAETATDADYAGIETVIAHEYFHNWTGNRITCRDWFQLCLKEGLTVFRDQEFSSDQRSRAVKRISDVRQLRAVQFMEDAGPLAHPVRPDTYREINNFYTPTVYEKGAEVIRVLKTLIGAQNFRKGMDLYFQRHDGTAATVEQFVRCFADASSQDLTDFMRWYSQAGTPEVHVTATHDPAAKTMTLDITQSLAPTPGQPTKAPMVIPLALGLLDGKGHDLPLIEATAGKLSSNVLVLTKPAQRFVFAGFAERPVVSINRGFSAPVKLSVNTTPERLLALAGRDSDPFNRWQALQTLATSLLVADVAAARHGGATSDPAALIDAYRSTLGSTTLEPAFRALALTVPSEGDIAREIGKDIDPDAIFAARTALRRAIGIALATDLAAAYDANILHGAYSPDAASAGRRSLRNICLDLLASDGAPSRIAMAKKQFDSADNMTDRLAALNVLSQHNVPERQAALDAFYARYADDALVIDKWFAIQAAIPETETLARVKALLDHPAFSMSNPNRVRSLIGVFAQSNLTQFNRADGAGYEFLADIVQVLDPKNPQVAARLMTAFRTWRALEPGRRALAESALQRVAKTTGLSRDVADIAERSLAPV
ncbi:MAG TPA: aminopeptidase N [Xanthobacteraceae bacterium]|nr:aminopeptidase N [Xanthobacteraceae bacterium]